MQSCMSLTVTLFAAQVLLLSLKEVMHLCNLILLLSMENNAGKWALIVMLPLHFHIIDQE